MIGIPLRVRRMLEPFRLRGDDASLAIGVVIALQADKAAKPQAPTAGQLSPASCPSGRSP